MQSDSNNKSKQSEAIEPGVLLMLERDNLMEEMRLLEDEFNRIKDSYFAEKRKNLDQLRSAIHEKRHTQISEWSTAFIVQCQTVERQLECRKAAALENAKHEFICDQQIAQSNRTRDEEALYKQLLSRAQRELQTMIDLANAATSLNSATDTVTTTGALTTSKMKHEDDEIVVDRQDDVLRERDHERGGDSQHAERKDEQIFVNSGARSRTRNSTNNNNNNSNKSVIRQQIKEETNLISNNKNGNNDTTRQSQLLEKRMQLAKKKPRHWSVRMSRDSKYRHLAQLMLSQSTACFTENKAYLQSVAPGGRLPQSRFSMEGLHTMKKATNLRVNDPFLIYNLTQAKIDHDLDQVRLHLGAQRRANPHHQHRIPHHNQRAH